ncbi:hypothetical protein BBJ28_00025860 [Nothophytophthora sp. Chile5]|nr:hypothetical protein BBJ28_00025860 [Nothophytophthora sp. Chile5]
MVIFLENKVGARTLFEGPLGQLVLPYGDFTVSGKSLQCVEEYLMREVLLLYGNPHPTPSITKVEEVTDEALRWFVYPSEVAEAIKTVEKPALPAVRGPYQLVRYLSGTQTSMGGHDSAKS